MTTAVVVKVDDGYVLASDSATTIGGSSPTGDVILNIYNNANIAAPATQSCTGHR